MATPGYGSFAQAEHEILEYMLSYYSQLRPHYYNGGLAPNDTGSRYWLGYKDMAKIVDQTFLAEWYRGFE